MTIPPTPPPTLLIANASNTVVGSVSVAARVSPVRALVNTARAHPVWMACSVLVLAAIVALEAFDNDDVNKSIRHWQDAARLLGDDQFGAALAATVPDADDWDFADRDAFDAFLRKLEAEIESLAAAFTANAEALTAARDFFNDAVDGLVAILLPVLLTVIAAVALQAFPPMIPLAEAIGIAGATITIAVLAATYAQIVSFFGALANAVGASDRFAFVADSQPGWAKQGKDPDIKDITIDWVLDPTAYRK